LEFIQFNFHFNCVVNNTPGSAAQVQNNKIATFTQLEDYKQEPLNPDPSSSTVRRRNTQRPKTVSITDVGG